MRGLVTFAAYLPYRRLERASVGAFHGSGTPKGTRAVAGHDEDTTTLGTESLLGALGVGGPGTQGVRDLIRSLHFVTTAPAYLDKSNASVLHAVAGLDPAVPAYDAGGSLRSGIGELRNALENAPVLPGDRPLSAIVLSDLRDGLPTSADESNGGDGAAAFVIGDSPGKSATGSSAYEMPIVAEYLGGASVTEEFLDRWRTPGERHSRTWEERFGETRYLEVGHDAWQDALSRCGLDLGDISRVAVTGMHTRAVTGLARKLGVAVSDISDSVGRAGCAEPGIALAALVEEVPPGDVVGVVHLADGADVLFFRVTEEAPERLGPRSVATQIACGAPLSYAKFLNWRQMLAAEPPRRPEPARVSAPAAWRSNEWKYRLAGQPNGRAKETNRQPGDRARETNRQPGDRARETNWQPGDRARETTRTGADGGKGGEVRTPSLAGAIGTVATFTVDRLAYSPSPPIIFAMVDFESGERLACELTDCEEDEIGIGTRVETTFRRLSTAGGIHNYFWKGRPVRTACTTRPGTGSDDTLGREGGYR